MACRVKPRNDIRLSFRRVKQMRGDVRILWQHLEGLGCQRKSEAARKMLLPRPSF
jgi:hypothetical protein